MTSPWLVAGFQNNFTSVFLFCPFAKNAKMVLLCWTKWLSELKIGEKTLKDRMNQMTSEKYLNFFLLMTSEKYLNFFYLWRFENFSILIFKISQKLFKPLPCHKFQYLTVLENCCMPAAYLQWRFHSGEGVVAHEPLVSFFFPSLTPM